MLKPLPGPEWWGRGAAALPPRYRGEAFADQAGIILGKIRPLSKTDFKVAQVFGDGSS